MTCRPAKELVLSKEKPIPYQPPLPPNEAPSGVDAAAGVTPVGLRPPFVTPAAAHSHPDCRGIPILIVAPQCVNMQTSFMHPPFGFALFYLRGIAPKEVKSSDIYWGAIPWVMMQIILVIIVIYWPQSVTYWLSNPAIDTTNVHIDIPVMEQQPWSMDPPNK